MYEKCCEISIHTSIHTQTLTHKYEAKPLLKAEKMYNIYTHCLCWHCLRTLHSVLLHSRNSFDVLGKVQAAEFVMFCLFMSIKSLVFRGCDISSSVHGAANLLVTFCFVYYNLVLLRVLLFLRSYL